MKKAIGRILAIFIALILIGCAFIISDIQRYGEGKVSFAQVVEVNLRHNVIPLAGHDSDGGEYFLTDHDWRAEKLLQHGYKKTDRMGDVYFFTAPDGTKFSVRDSDQWCPWFRIHKISGMSLHKVSFR